MTIAEEPVAPRNVFVSFLPASEAKIVRFKGSTFGELKGRLNEARVPGYSTSSFVELQLGEGQFVCLLDNEELPSGDLVVSVQQSGKYPYARGRVYSLASLNGCPARKLCWPERKLTV